MTDDIPSTIRNLKQLQILNLGQNRLSSHIPDSLSQLHSLRVLSLQRNRFSGPLPFSLSTLTQLQELRLYGNQLSGNIPPALGSLSSLTFLQLSDNQFTGNIPDELGRLTQLKELWLYRNELVGELPVALGKLSNLRVLGANRNKLTGCIPQNFSRLWKLTYLDLTDNPALHGEIPRLVHLPHLDYLRLDIGFGGNGFDGDLAKQLREIGWGSLRRERYRQWLRKRDFVIFIHGYQLHRHQSCDRITHELKDSEVSCAFHESTDSFGCNVKVYCERNYYSSKEPNPVNGFDSVHSRNNNDIARIMPNEADTSSETSYMHMESGIINNDQIDLDVGSHYRYQQVPTANSDVLSSPTCHLHSTCGYGSCDANNMTSHGVVNSHTAYQVFGQVELCRIIAHYL